MQSSDWLNVTVKSTICQACMITLLSTSTVSYSLRDNEIGDSGASALANALRVNQSLKTLR